jgi:hypothetical protein
MTRLLFLTFLLIGTLPGKTQIVGDRANKYAAQNSIDTFLIYSFPCSGGIPFDSCQFDDPHYLIWRQNGDFFLKRFDYCKTYKTLSVDTSNPLTFYLSNKRIIDKEEIRQPTYYEIKKKKTTVDTLMVTSSVSHSCYHKYQLPLTKKAKYKYADTYDLDFKTFDNGKKNIYYNYNQRTRLKALIDLTTSLIDKFKGENRFQDE